MTDSEVSFSGETLGKGCLGIHGPDLQAESGCACAGLNCLASFYGLVLGM